MNAKKIIYSLAIVFATIGTLASCNDNDDNSMIFTGHFVIEGSYPNYTLYHPGGYTFHLLPASVQQVTNGNGFGAHKRCFFQLSFKEADVVYSDPVNKKGDVVVNNAQVLQGSYVDEQAPMHYATAEAKNQTVADSIFNIKKFTDYWYHRGYLNIALEGSYSVVNNKGVYPAMTLTFNEDDISENAISLNLLYNRHTSKDASSQPGSFITAYTFDNIIYQVPGNDSIRVRLSSQGAETVEFKIGRR